jgi:hypothetical protein
MPLQVVIHEVVERAKTGRVMANQVRSQLPNAGPHTLGVAGQIERPQWTNFSIPGDPGIGLDADYCCIEDLDGLATRPSVGALMQGQVNLVDVDS